MTAPTLLPRIPIPSNPLFAGHFWDRVDTTGECWPWTGARQGTGYGRVALGGHRVAHAHRVSWVLTFGPIPSDSFVCHRCDNPPCVRPSHLFLGTHLDNIADMMSKGRHARGGSRKLTVEQVRSIKDSLPTQTKAQLARSFGVSRRLVRAIAQGEIWTWV